MQQMRNANLNVMRDYSLTPLDRQNSAIYYPSMHITPSQCRAARAHLCLAQADLSERTGLSRDLIHRFEAGRVGLAPAMTETLVGLFREAGIVFFEAPLGGFVTMEDGR
jgi:hypothetical protein